MKKIFKALWIVQEKPKPDAFRKSRKVQRANPYNPLSYVVIAISLVYFLICHGLVGCWPYVKELKDVFKYQ